MCGPRVGRGQRLAAAEAQEPADDRRDARRQITAQQFLRGSSLLLQPRRSLIDVLLDLLPRQIECAGLAEHEDADGENAADQQRPFQESPQEPAEREASEKTHAEARQRRPVAPERLRSARITGTIKSPERRAQNGHGDGQAHGERMPRAVSWAGRISVFSRLIGHYRRIVSIPCGPRAPIPYTRVKAE